MKVSIVIPVLNSHEIVRRHILFWGRMNVWEDVEIILVDDGSDPQHQSIMYDLESIKKIPLKFMYTHDTRDWTWALARNFGAKYAQGKYLLMTDIDHILDEKMIQFVKNFDGIKIQFLREFAILNEWGKFSQDRDTLEMWGLETNRKIQVPPLPNNFAMRKDVFWDIGGYREDCVGKPYPQREDSYFKKAWCDWMRDNNAEVCTERPIIYLFPNGKFCGDVDYNPFGLFHTLTRKTAANPFYKK